MLNFEFNFASWYGFLDSIPNHYNRNEDERFIFRTSEIPIVINKRGNFLAILNSNLSYLGIITPEDTLLSKLSGNFLANYVIKLIQARQQNSVETLLYRTKEYELYGNYFYLRIGECYYKRDETVTHDFQILHFLSKISYEATNFEICEDFILK